MYGEKPLQAAQKLGDLLARMKKNKGAAGQGRPKIGGSPSQPPKKASSPTLAEMGIKKKTSHLAQKINALPPDQTQAVFKEARDLGRPVTLADVLAKAKPYAAKISNAAKHRYAWSTI
jgi:hypothetical protein